MANPRIVERIDIKEGIVLLYPEHLIPGPLVVL
jgi:hypothetical protein